MGQELVQHHKVGSGYIHKLTNWRFPDTATRNSLTNQFVAADVDKLCYDVQTAKYYFLEAVDVGTGAPTWKEVPLAIANVGEANTVSNIGSGAQIYKQKTGVNFELKTLKGISGVTISVDADSITFESTAAAPTWGSITGSLSAQTDLWTVLQSKADTGSFAAIGHTHALATGSTDGFLSSTLWTKLSGLVSNATHTGDVTGSTALTIAPKAVTFGKMLDLTAPGIVIGRATSGAGSPEELNIIGRGLVLDGSNIQVSGQTTTKLAATAVGGGRVLRYTSSTQVGYADSTVLADKDFIAGISLGAAILGDSVVVQISGEITDGSWTWTPNSPIYLGTGGLITQTIPTTGFLLQLGIALSATIISVKIGIPVVF